ncbi:MAG TPA: radical SAM protein, partial [bacterium]
CFHNCAFCQTRGRKPLYRSPESIERFLDELVKLGYVFRTGFICPSGFEYGCDRAGKWPVEALARLLASAKARGIRYLEYGIFPSEVRPDTVSHETVNLVKKYCSNRKITLGAQSASDPVLKREKRGHSAGSIERAAALIREHGLRPQIDYILGFPDETEEDQVLTLQQMERLSVRYGAWNQVHYFLPLAGTPQFRQKSASISPKIVRLLEKWSRNGYASNWWKQGVKTAKNLERFKQSGISAS